MSILFLSPWCRFHRHRRYRWFRSQLSSSAFLSITPIWKCTSAVKITTTLFHLSFLGGFRCGRLVRMSPTLTMTIHDCSHLNRVFYVHKKLDIFSARIFAIFIFAPNGFDIVCSQQVATPVKLWNISYWMCAWNQTFAISIVDSSTYSTRNNFVLCFYFSQFHLHCSDRMKFGSEAQSTTFPNRAHGYGWLIGQCYIIEYWNESKKFHEPKIDRRAKENVENISSYLIWVDSGWALLPKPLAFYFIVECFRLNWLFPFNVFHFDARAYAQGKTHIVVFFVISPTVDTYWRLCWWIWLMIF